MTDREKVIKGLECCAAYEYKCNDCPYQDDGGAEDGCYSDELKTDALALLKAQEPMVMTLEEFNAHWKTPPQERQPIWEEWKFDNGKGKWKLYGRATGGYGKMWRCWTSRPTDEQREAVPWE